MSDQQEKLSGVPYVIGGLSFIPTIGIVFGLIAIVWGLRTKKLGGKKLAIIGGIGILFTIIPFSLLIYFSEVKRGGVFDELRIKQADSALIRLVQAIEFYKIQNGNYPDSLENLNKSLPKESLVFVVDPTTETIGGKTKYFYYELIDKYHYYLLGLGQDGKPFTMDDIAPQVQIGSTSKVGLVIRKLPK